MANDVLNIKRVTLEKIGNAIKIYHAKRSNTISGKIPVREFAKALRDGTVETTAPVATEDEYIIRLKTLTGLADEVRSIGDTTDEIGVSDLEERIINLMEKLPAPIIEIAMEIVDAGSGETTPPTPLSKPQIKIEKVESDAVEDEKPKPVELDPPEIAIVFIDSDSDVEEEPIITPLDEPSIYIVEVVESEEDTPEVVIKQLDAPKIVIVRVDTEAEEEDEKEPIRLDSPAIEIEKVEEDIEEDIPSITPLGKPNISIVSVTTDNDEEQPPVPQALDKPDVKIEVLETETDKEPEIIITQLDKPDITIEKIIEQPEAEEKPTIQDLGNPNVIIEIEYARDDEEQPTIPKALDEPDIEIEEITEQPEAEEEHAMQKLGYPEICIEIDYSRDEEEPTITITKLAEPAIEIVSAIGFRKMPFDNRGIIDANGKVQDSNAWSGKAHSNIVAIKDLVNGPDGYCVQDFDTTFPEYPKVLFFSAPRMLAFVGGLNVTDIGNKDTLTVEEIKYFADTLFDGAAYVAFNSDYEEEVYKEDFAYILADADTYELSTSNGVLKTPSISLVAVEVGGEEEEEQKLIKLDTPSIEIYIDGILEDNTTAILGRAILGEAILGNDGI